MRILVFALLLTISATAVMADSLMLRTDCSKGNQPSNCIGYMAPEGEIWYFEHFSLEAGKLSPVKTGNKSFTLLAGGYLSRWEQSKQVFAEPYIWACLGKEDGVQIKGDVYGYIPLGHGPKVLGVSDISLSNPVSDDTRAGLSMTLWQENGAPAPIRWGPWTEIKKSDFTSVLRYTPFGGGGLDLVCFRLQTTYTW